MQRTIWLCATALLFASPALALDINAPDQVIPGGQVGVLQVDLVCDPPRVGVFLEDGATLDMNGHTLDGCTVDQSGVLPVRRISVRGPGMVLNAGIGIRSGTLRVRDVIVANAPTFGILGSGDFEDGPSTLVLKGVTVTGSALDGIRATKVSATNVTSSGNGVVGPTGQGIVAGGGVKGRNLHVNDNQTEGISVSGGNVVLRNSEVTGNALGGVGAFGISRSALVLIDSTVTGNDAVPGGWDIASQREPRLRGSTCGSSLNAQTSTPWGVCTND